MAILLKRNRKAMAVARMVCRPRNGEKAMKTPIEKASAVRSGGSSIASRRRNAARNINSVQPLCSLCLCGGSQQQPQRHREHRGCTEKKSYLLKTLQRFCFVVERIENGKQFC